MAAMSLLRQSLHLFFLFFSVALPSPAATSAHPFLDRERPIRWSRLTQDKLEPDIQEAMRLTRTAIEEISRLHPEEMTYEIRSERWRKAMTSLRKACARLMS